MHDDNGHTYMPLQTTHTHFFQGHHGFGILEKPFGFKNSNGDYDELLFIRIPTSFVFVVELAYFPKITPG